MADKRLTGPLLNEALLVKTQAALYLLEIENGQLRADLARERLTQLQAGRAAMETRLLSQLSAPPGARFNWDTFSYDEPEPEPEPPPPQHADGPAAAARH